MFAWQASKERIEGGTYRKPSSRVGSFSCFYKRSIDLFGKLQGGSPDVLAGEHHV